jgi:anti-sigma B factor antagonist
MVMAVNGLTLSGHRQGPDLRIVVEGELDVASAPDLEVALEALVHPGMRIALDLDGLSFVDAAGLRLLAAVSAAAARDGWELVLAGAQAHLRAIAAICGLERHLPLAHT